MAHKTVAIPARLLKPDNELTKAERAELAQYGDQPLTTLEQVDVTAAQTREKTKPVEYSQARREKLAVLDGEGMDSIRKAIAAIKAGEPVPVEFDAYMEKVDAIKQAHPKPKE